MGDLVLKGATSGQITVTPTAVAGTNTLTLPARTGNVITSADTATVTTAMLTDANVTPAKLSQPLTLATSQNTTSGTNIDFTGIPSWVRRITVMFNGVSTSGTSVVRIQIGSGSVQTSGYTGSGATIIGAAVNSGSFSASGLDIGVMDAGSAASVRTGIAILSTLGSNVWVLTGSHADPPRNVFYSGGVSLSGTIDRLRLTTVNGTDTFDAGSVNIMYEG